MDKLIISYKHMNDWYVGEIHKYFHERFVLEYPSIKFEFVENNELKQRYNLGDYSQNFPSILNQYNFILINPKNNHTYVNSLNDFAPFCLYPNSGVENFDVKKFTFCSNFSDNLLDPIKKYNPEPSFYILENFSDLNRIKKYRTKKRTINKAHFLGLIYGVRSAYQEIFEDSEFFEFRSKSDPQFFKDKEGYFDLISNYKMSFSVDGAAKICHRDIESIGVGNLLIRESLEIKTHSPLIPDIHYIELIKPEEKGLITSHDQQKKYFKELLEDRLKEKISNHKKNKEIIQNGINWFDENCIPEKQFELVNSFTNNLQILI